MTKLEEMQARLAALLNTMQAHIDADELDKAEAVKKDLDILADKIEKQKLVDKMTEQLKVPEEPAARVPAPASDKTKDNANFIRACLKRFSGKRTSDIEDALLLPTPENVNGVNGEGYILPVDIRTRISRRIRQFRSLRSVCGALTTTALKGSFPVDDLDSLSGLVDFTDGNEGTDADDIKFTTVSFSLAEKAAFIKLSNTLLALTDEDLIAYIVDVFAKKAVITENEMAVAAITKNKTVKSLADWKAFATSLNTDLDPAAWANTVIVTNQDGFNYLDTLTDEKGNPMLTPDLSAPSRKLFRGFPVEVFSKRHLPTKSGKAPIYYGDLNMGVKFVDLNLMSFATSKDAGFMKNVTIARLIEFIDVVQNDSSDACYCVGALTITEAAG